MSDATDAYTIETATPEEEPAVRELLRAMIGETPITRWSEPFWGWKHRRSPFGPSYVGVARSRREGDRVVSVQHAMPWTLHTPEGEAVPATRPCDGSTYPEHQRKGLYTRIDRRTEEDLRERGVRLFFDTPNPLTLGRNMKTGWRIAGRLPQYWAPVHSLATLRALVRGSGPAEPAAPPESPGGARFPTWEGLLERFGPQVEEVAAAHEAGRTRVGLRTPRSPEYLRWRYGAIPTVGYRTFFTAQGEELRGFVVWRAAAGKRGLPTAIVTELFLREPSAQEAAALLQDLRRHLGAGYVLTYFPEGTMEHAALRRAGFWKVPRQRRIVTTKPLLPAGGEGGPEPSWDLTLGELEVF
ncbi:MAG: GNAT family N-acetyltransferase [Thermoanaerobaculia bacterium]